VAVRSIRAPPPLEDDLFPAVRKALGRTRLGELGEALAEAKAARSKRAAA
jgi:hypothetical protein